MTTPSLGFPTSIAEVTRDWLTAVLRNAGALSEGERVQGFESVRCGEPGQTSDVYRLALRYEGDAAQAPARLVLKFATTAAEPRAMAVAFGSYLRETRFYQQFAASARMPIPRCYFAEIGPSGYDQALLLEDLGDGREGDYVRGNVADVITAADHLAAFHAAWWQREELANCDWLFQATPELWALLRVVLLDAYSKLEAALGAKVPDAITRTVSAMSEHWDALLVNFQARPFTLIHRDYFLKQMFFPDRGRGRFAVFDWQNPAYGRATDDLARLVAQSLPPALRREHERAIVQRYHAGLCASGVQGYDLEQAWKQYRMSMLSTMLIDIIVITHTDVAIYRDYCAKRDVDWRDPFCNWIAQALEDHAVVDLITDFVREHTRKQPRPDQGRVQP
jgi:hypothetical protein